MDIGSCGQEYLVDYYKFINMIKFYCFLFSILIVTNCSRKEMKNDVRVSLEIVKHNSDVYLVTTVFNESKEDIYLIDWRLAQMIEVYDSANIRRIDFIEREFFYQTRVKQVGYQLKSNEVFIDYEDIISGENTLRKKLIKEAIESETKEIKCSQKNNISNRDWLMIRDLIFSKYKDAIFIKSNSFFKDSISVTTLYVNNSQNKIKFNYKLKDLSEEYVVDSCCENKIVVTSRPLDQISSYKFFNNEIVEEIAW